MVFDKQDLQLIAKAKAKSAEVHVKRIAVALAMVVGVGLMVTGVVDADKVAYFFIAAVFFSLALPQFGDGPKYEDLVALLEKKANSVD